MKTDYDYEWNKYLTNFVMKDTGVLDEKDIYYMDKGATSKDTQIKVLTVYRNPKDRRRNENKSVLIEMTYTEFVRNHKIETLLEKK